MLASVRGNAAMPWTATGNRPVEKRYGRAPADPRRSGGVEGGALRTKFRPLCLDPSHLVPFCEVGQALPASLRCPPVTGRPPVRKGEGQDNSI